MVDVTVSELLRLAAQHFEAGDLAQAEATCRAALLRYPDHPAVLHLLGLVISKGTDAIEGLVLLRKAIELAPNVAAYYCNAAPALLALGRAEEAVNMCHRALSIQKDYPEAFFHLGAAQLARWRYKDAVEAFQRAISLKSIEADHWGSRAAVLRQQGDIEGASACDRYQSAAMVAVGGG